MFDASGYRARDFMSRDVAVVQPETPLRRAVQILAERGVGGLPVLDHRGMLVGMVTEGDLARWREDLPAREEHWLETLGEGFEIAPAYLDLLRADRATVKHAMHPGPVVTIPEDMPASEIATLMHEKGIKRVPVITDGRMVGIVSRSDLVRMLARWLDEQEESRRRGALPGFASASAGSAAPPAQHDPERHRSELPTVDAVDAVLGIVDPANWSSRPGKPAPNHRR